MANIRPQLPAVPKNIDTPTRIFLTAVANIIRDLSRSEAQASKTTQGASSSNAVQVSGLSKNSIGLGNVDNTADKDKPINQGMQNALNQKINKSDFNNFKDNLNYVGEWNLPTQTLSDIGAENGNTYEIIGQGSYAGNPLKEGDFVKFFINEDDELDIIVFINGEYKVDKTTSITAGNGLTGGGDLSASRTLSLGVPSDISSTSTNAVTTNSHTHALDETGILAGTYTKVIFDVKGRALNGGNLIATDIPSLSWSKITTGKPTTLAGYGITDAINTSQIGTANGLASLGADGKIPITQLPAMTSSGAAVPLLLSTIFNIPDNSQVLFSEEIEFDENGEIDIGLNSVLAEVS